MDSAINKFNLELEKNNELDKCYKLGDYLYANYISNFKEDKFTPKGSLVYNSTLKCAKSVTSYHIESDLYSKVTGTPLLLDVLVKMGLITRRDPTYF